MWAPKEESPWTPSAAIRWWLHHAFGDIHVNLQKNKIFFNHCYEPAIGERDLTIVKSFKKSGVKVHAFHSNFFNPYTIKNKFCKPFQVFTLFWRHCFMPIIRKRQKANINRLKFPTKYPKRLNIQYLKLLPKIK